MVEYENYSPIYENISSKYLLVLFNSRKPITLAIHLVLRKPERRLNGKPSNLITCWVGTRISLR
jgi:hypothetical protein